jgi:branched-chain amino acid transport system substrate-binding protein
MLSKKSGLIVALVLLVIVSACAPAAPVATPEPEVIVVTATPEPTPGPKPIPDEIKLGFYSSVTGAAAEMYEFQSKGAQIAQAMKPTVLGKPVKLILVDDKSEKSEAAIVMRRLIEEDEVVGVLGMSWSSLTLVAGEVSEEAGVPFIGSSPSNPLVVKDKDYAFTLVNTDDKGGPLQANYLVDYVGAETVVVIYNVQEDFPVGYANYFRDGFIKLTGDPTSVLAMLTFQTGDQDFSAQLETVKQLMPDAVFLPNYNQHDSLIVRQAAEMGLTDEIHFQVQEGWTYDTIPGLAGGAQDGTCCLSYYAPEGVDTELSHAYDKAFSEAFPGETPTFTDVLMFDCYMLMLDAIERANSVDPKAIRDAIADTEGFEGASGTITFKGHGGSPPRAVPALCYEGDTLVFDMMVPLPELD